ncbi:hypothetical protein [Microvirga sp. M2]|uniref:hypothetical protein n=1 Tax=Microvirga sp. M2 TaxID=3073270 RepID=UPI0039C49F87
MNQFRDGSSALGKANKGPQAIDQLRSLIRRQAGTGGIDQSRQLLTAGPAFPDFVSPHRDLGSRARTRGALINDLVGELNDLIERGSVRS